MNKYDGAGGAYTDKYFQPNMDSNKNQVSSDPNFMSLTGEKVGANYFEHSIIWFHILEVILWETSKNSNSNEGVLDNYVDLVLKILRKKNKLAICSSDNQQYAYGAPNANDFYQSRVNPSSKMANVKPFQEEMVGPGLESRFWKPSRFRWF